MRELITTMPLSSLCLIGDETEDVRKPKPVIWNSLPNCAGLKPYHCDGGGTHTLVLAIKD